MQNLKLSHRLQTVASFVPQGARLLDVGSDHAYLPIELLKEQKIDFAVAGEVVKGPFESACANVAQSHLQDKIAVRLANGLAALEREDAIDTITICGMGGRLIAAILGADRAKLKSVSRLILQPNNREDELRKWLQTNAFNIVAERIVTENQKFYEIIVAEHGKMALTNQECRFGPHLLRERSAIFDEKWAKEYQKLAKVLANIPSHHKSERQQLIQKMETIKEVKDEC